MQANNILGKLAKYGTEIFVDNIVFHVFFDNHMMTSIRVPIDADKYNKKNPNKPIEDGEIDGSFRYDNWKGIEQTDYDEMRVLFDNFLPLVEQMKQLYN